MAHETKTIHEGIEGGLVFSEQDLLRCQLLNQDSLGQGINVQLYQVNCMVPTARITMRALDKNLYDIEKHPALMSHAVLQGLIDQKASEINNHVKEVVRVLLTSKSIRVPPLTRHQGGITALQYITMQDIKASATTFNHHIHENFVKFVKKTFFSSAYLNRVMGHNTRVSDQVFTFT